MSNAGVPPAWQCVLTGEGRGAIAVVRLWGPGALSVADAAFHPRRRGRLGEGAVGQLRYGSIGAGRGDEVVATVLPGNPPEVEVHCHGGPAPLALVIDALESAGAQKRPAEHWLRTDSVSSVAAEARVDLARASTLRVAEILLDQAQGALDRDCQQVIDARDANLASALGPRESLIPPPVTLHPPPATALGLLESLIQRAEVGSRLLDGWRVVLAGRPNVGKSRLLNALAGFGRAIVDPAPGTTRDVVTVRTAFDGWPVELADTAGLRDSDDPIESSGMHLAIAEQERADLVLLVLDRSEPLTEADRQLAGRHPHALWVTNKADLPAAWEPQGPRRLIVSAERGDGIDLLAKAIAQRLVPAPPPPGAAVPFRDRHVRLLCQAQEQLAAGRVEAARQAMLDLRGSIALIDQQANA
ncbi:MAG TPA: GTPase [Isosphaeraceae bacterium]|nr:GTPase [Isosphaeraceae bacterium]